MITDARNEIIKGLRKKASKEYKKIMKLK